MIGAPRYLRRSFRPPMSVLLRVFLVPFVLVFALLLMRGAIACEPVAAVSAASITAARMPVDCQHAERSASRVGACASTPHHAGCCIGCGADAGLLPTAFSSDARSLRHAAPRGPRESRRADVVRAPLLPPPIA